MMKPIRTCVIGLGFAGKRHLGRLMELPEFDVVGVADPQYRGPSIATQVFADYRVMLDKTKPDAAFVCTPHHTHAQIVTACLDHGMAIFCEKPAAPTEDGCQQMIAAQTRNLRPVAVGYHHIGHENAQWLKRCITNGLLGRIKEVVVIMPNYRPDEYYERASWMGKMKVDGEWCLDGMLGNQMIHFINQAMFFASMHPAPHVASYVIGSMKAALYRVHDTFALESDDLAVLQCQLSGGVKLFCVGTTALEGGGKLTIEVIGEKGRAIYDGTVQVLLDSDKPFTTQWSDEPDYIYRNFADVVNHDVSPLSPLKEAVKPTAILEAAFKTVDHQIKKITWDDVSGLRGLLYRSAQYRCLFSELPDSPDWA